MRIKGNEIFKLFKTYLVTELEISMMRKCEC